MVARARGYQEDPFKGYRGGHTGNPLPPTIFNVLVETALRHRATEETGEETGPDRFGRAAGQMANFFYADNRLLASTRAEQFQQAFNVLADILDRVGPRMNVGKMVSMVC